MSKAYQTQGHKFRFKVLTIDGKTRTLVFNTKVRKPKKPVVLELAADHIQKALDVKGFGNTENCMMAVCAKENAKKFSHPVDGYIDWQYRTCFVVSKINKDGMPTECYGYVHNCKFAQHFDKFLVEPESKKIIMGVLHDLKEKGPMQINLLLPKKRKPRREPKGKLSGIRSKTASKGAHLRFAVTHPGL